MPGLLGHGLNRKPQVRLTKKHRPRNVGIHKAERDKGLVKVQDTESVAFPLTVTQM